jgi:hypothetical protein
MALRTRVLALGALVLLPALAYAQDGTPLSISVPEKMINDGLKGQSWKGDGTYDAGPVLGEIPYNFTLSEVSTTLKEGFAEIYGTAEVTSKGYTYKEKVTGKVKVAANEKTQTVRVNVENLLVPIYVPVFGAKKRLGEIDLASNVGKLEVESAPFLAQASSLLPSGQEISLKALAIVAGFLKADILLKAKK